MVKFQVCYQNRFQKDRKTSQVLRDFDKKNNKKYEELYNTYLEIMRQEVIKLFNANRKNTLEYIKEKFKRRTDTPTMN